jgi:hypothetical protein
MCCACSGSCNHVGPHSYCAAHGGLALAPVVDAGTGTSFVFVPSAPSDEPSADELARELAFAVTAWLASDADDESFAEVERLAGEWRRAVVEDRL